MRLAVLVLAVTLAAVLAISLQHSNTATRPAPALPRSALTGAPVTLASIRGKPALIAFFASWCGPCTAEAPVLERTARRLAGRARLIAVDWSDNPASGRAFVGRFHWTFPVLADPNGTTGYRFGIQGLPTTFVLDGRGYVVARLIGPQTVAKLLQALRAGPPRG